MSHYDDFYAAVGELLRYLNDLSLSFLAGCAIWMAVHFIWHVCAVVGELLGIALWLIVHAA